MNMRNGGDQITGESKPNRRNFMAVSAGAAVGSTMVATQRISAESNSTSVSAQDSERLFDISVAQWSLHRQLQQKKLDNLDFATTCKEQFGTTAVEYVNSFFKDKAKDKEYLGEMKKRCDDNGIKSLLIMCDGEGQLGDPDPKLRTAAVENHYKWVDAAKFLGCHSIRVNAASSGGFDEQIKLAADGLSRLSEYAKKHEMNVLVENHGGLSSNGQWLAKVMKMVDQENCGTLPDFGNFNLGGGKTYDRYQGVAELMPFAKAVSAKSHEFDDRGNEAHTDFVKMMKIVLAAGYKGYVGIEFEGGKVSEYEGIRATRNLLNRVHDQLKKG